MNTVSRYHPLKRNMYLFEGQNVHCVWPSKAKQYSTIEKESHTDIQGQINF